MHVLATAGHVDHGKSTLVRALTGMEPDRWAEERRRGMTIDLGFAWTGLPSGETVAFVDVPGHERFVPNMLAGVGPVPAAMFVVAADEGWMPQSAEHLAALRALDVRHYLLVVTRSDLTDPDPATREALARITTAARDAPADLGAAAAGVSGTTGAGLDVEAVAVSGTTGAGLGKLRAALDRLVARLPAADPDAPVRLWIDRVFTVRGAGTVVTGTLGAGRLRAGDELQLDDQKVRIRGLQSLGEPAGEVGAVARVAVNLRGTPRDGIGRGSALLTPGRFRFTDLIDVRVHGDPAADLPATLTLHAGSAAVPVRVRPLGADTARLRLSRPLPLRIGDRALLRDPGRHHVAGGVTVLDCVPPGLSRRGAATARAAVLAGLDGRPDLGGELRRRLLIRGPDLAAMGVPLPGVPAAERPDRAAAAQRPSRAAAAEQPHRAAATEKANRAVVAGQPAGLPVVGDWYAEPGHWAALGERLAVEVARHRAEHPLEPGMPLEALRHRLGLPDRDLVTALARAPLTVRGGRVSAGPGDAPGDLAERVAKVFGGLGEFAAPEGDDLTALGLGPRELAAAERHGLVVRLGPAVVLRPGVADRAAEVLAGVPQPFTLSEARRALDTTRRVAVPLLEFLDRAGRTRRLPDDRRTVSG